jgi:hypothetical protein
LRQRFRLPTAAERAIDIDQCDSQCPRGVDARSFGREQASLRVEHFEKRRITSVVAKLRKLERLREPVPALGLRGAI